MLRSIYETLNLGPLIKTGIIIQLVNHSYVYSIGVLEDVLVQVGCMIIPTNFYIIDMEDATHLIHHPFF
jgi:hypothetical protein